MRTVFTNDMCAHVWAQLKQPHGRSGSMRFDGAVAYSYAQPVAHLIKPFGKDKHVALFTSRKWSVTTSAHITDYRRAASQYDQFTVPDIFAYDARRVRDEQSTAETHAENLEYFRAEYDSAAAALMRAPADSWRLRESVAHERVSRCVDYCAAFGIPAPEWCGTWNELADKATARRDKLLNDPKRAAKIAAREKARAEKAAREHAEKEARRLARLAELADIVRQWRAGADMYLPWDAQRTAEGSAMLRVRGDKVQTSQGAEAPISDVRRVLSAVYDHVARGETWQRDTRYSDDRQETYSRLGHFRLDSIDAEGNVRAGCHYITAAEIAALRAAL